MKKKLFVTFLLVALSSIRLQTGYIKKYIMGIKVIILFFIKSGG